MEQQFDPLIAAFLAQCPTATAADAMKMLTAADGAVEDAVIMYQAKMKKPVAVTGESAPVALIAPVAGSPLPFFKSLYDHVGNLFREAKTAAPDSSPLINAVVIGETGSGKSTFINFLLNALKSGTTLESLSDCLDHETDNANGSAGQSVTDACRDYVIETPWGRLVLLDTPGFGDTRGVEVTANHVKDVGTRIGSLQIIHAIIIVVNGTNCRYTATARYVFHNIGLLLPAAARGNVVVVATNCRDSLSENLNVSKMMQECGLPGNPTVFHFDNPLGLWNNIRSRQMELTPKIRQDLQKRFEEADSEVRRLMSCLFSMRPHPTNEFRELVEAQQEAELQFGKYLQETANRKKETVELERVMSNVNTFASDKAQYRGYANGLTVRVLVRTPSSQANTLCEYPDCGSNCHAPCNLDFGADLRQCNAISSDGTCNVCRHNVRHHKHYPHTNVWVTKNEDDPDMKARFENAKSNEEREAVLLADLQKRLAKLEASLKESKDRAISAVRTLSQKAALTDFQKFLGAKKDLIKERLAAVDPKMISCPKCGAARDAAVLLTCEPQQYHVLCLRCDAEVGSVCPMCRVKRQTTKLTPELIATNHPQNTALRSLLNELNEMEASISEAAAVGH